MTGSYSDRFGKLSLEAKKLWRRVVQGTFSFEKNEEGVSLEALNELQRAGFISNLEPARLRYVFVISNVDHVYLLRPLELKLLGIIASSGLDAEDYLELVEQGHDPSLLDKALDQLEVLEFVVREDQYHNYILAF